MKTTKEEFLLYYYYLNLQRSILMSCLSCGNKLERMCKNDLKEVGRGIIVVKWCRRSFSNED